MSTFSVISLVILVLGSGLLIGAMYLAGGSDALRRQMPIIAAVIVGGAVMLFVVVPIANAEFGAASVGFVLLATSLLLNIAQSRRSGPPLTKPITGPGGRVIQPRQVIVVALGLAVLLMAGTTLIAIALRP